MSRTKFFIFNNMNTFKARELRLPMIDFDSSSCLTYKWMYRIQSLSIYVSQTINFCFCFVLTSYTGDHHWLTGRGSPLRKALQVRCFDWNSWFLASRPIYSRPIVIRINCQCCKIGRFYRNLDFQFLLKYLVVITRAGVYSLQVITVPTIPQCLLQISEPVEWGVCRARRTRSIGGVVSLLDHTVGPGLQDPVTKQTLPASRVHWAFF